MSGSDSEGYAVVIDLDFSRVDRESFCNTNYPSARVSITSGSKSTQVLYTSASYPFEDCTFTPFEYTTDNLPDASCVKQSTDITYKIDQSSYRLLCGSNVVTMNPETGNIAFNVQDFKKVK